MKKDIFHKLVLFLGIAYGVFTFIDNILSIVFAVKYYYGAISIVSYVGTMLFALCFAAACGIMLMAKPQNIKMFTFITIGVGGLRGLFLIIINFINLIQSFGSGALWVFSSLTNSIVSLVFVAFIILAVIMAGKKVAAEKNTYFAAPAQNAYAAQPAYAQQQAYAQPAQQPAQQQVYAQPAAANTANDANQNAAYTYYQQPNNQ